MHSSRSSIVIIVMLALLSWQYGAAQVNNGQQQSFGGVFRIAGHVVNAKTGYPLARARVSITDTRNPQRTLSLLASEDGKFEFNGVTAGKFALEGAKRGFIRAAYDQHDQFSTAIVTGAGLDTENLTLRLDPVAVLTGKVLDESGDPVRNATVTIYREDHFSGVSRIRRFRAGQTDDRGSYEISALDAGTYFLAARAKPWYEVHPRKSQPPGLENVPSSVDSSLDVAYPTTYYADTTDSDEATPIPIRGGDRLDVDIHLNPVPALHLLLQVANDRNNFNMPVLHESTFDGSEEPVSVGMEGISPGLFEMTGVPAGRYTARFSYKGQVGPPTPVDLASDGQQLTPPTGDALSTLKVTVRVRRELRLPSQLVVTIRDRKRKVVAGGEVDAEGQVDLGVIEPGSYDISAFSYNNSAFSSDKAYSVTRISTQGSDISGHTLTVSAGSPMVVSLTLVAGMVNVEGIAKRAGKAAPGVMIALVPKDPEHNRELFRRDQSDLDGSFNLRSVIPGTYTVVAIENGWDLDWAQPAVIAHYAEHGEAITIDQQSEGSVHLPAVIEVQPR
jgi:Carboxypeptidase regulatory-like domain